jgi:thiol reductant ABC exporter CydC subunit
VADPTPTLLAPLVVERRRTLLALSAGILTGLSTIGLLTTSAWLIVRSAERPPVFSLTVVMGLVQLFALSRAVFRYLERLGIHDGALRTLSTTRRQVFVSLARIVPGGLGGRHDAAVTNGALEDVDLLEDLYVGVLPPLVVGAVITLAATTIAGLLSPLSALVLATGLLLTAVVLPWTMVVVVRTPTERRDAAREVRREATDDLVTSSLELSCSPQLEARLGELAAATTAIHLAERSLAWRRGTIGGLSLVASVATVATLAVVASSAVATGALAASAVAVLPLLAMGAIEITSAMSPALSRYPADSAAAGRLGDLIAAPAPWPEPGRPGPDMAQARVLSLDEVVIGHDAALLTALSLEIAPGARLAIVGPSGSGKSTLLDALARFVPPRAGTIRLDGADLAGLLGSQVRHRVASLEQEPHLFTTDLEANVRLARPGASDGEVVEALEAAGLAQRMDRGDRGATASGEGGVELSGGERRRVGLARILLSDAPIALLDEPTEGLDEETAARVVATLCASAGDRALVIATHRTSDAAAMDRVFDLVDGHLVERTA